MQQDDTSAPVSKTQRKREMHELQALGERLASLNDSQLGHLAGNLPEELLDAVREGRSITRHEARRRHMQYIGRLMRSVDPDPIRDKLAEWDGQSKGATARLHQIERWRDRLIEDEGALAEYLAAHRDAGPAIDIQHLRTLIRNCRDERARAKQPRFFRELFRELKRIAECLDETSPVDRAPAEEPQNPERSA